MYECIILYTRHVIKSTRSRFECQNIDITWIDRNFENFLNRTRGRRLIYAIIEISAADDERCQCEFIDFCERQTSTIIDRYIMYVTAKYISQDRSITVAHDNNA